jgi:D-amino peptidase
MKRMKIFISADMEGLTTTTFPDDYRRGTQDYPYHARQMAAEVAAACEGAINAGAKEIYIKDAHDEGNNIDGNLLPKCTKLIKNWSGHPYGMVEGIDRSFDACMFIGYHAAAGGTGNPLSHTLSHSPFTVTLNGRPVSEFMIYSYVAALEGVPVVFLSGDKQICEDASELCPAITTVSVKEGLGASTISLQPQYACDLIREQAEAALKQDLSKAGIVLPKDFYVEICYHEHQEAEKMSYFPGVKKIGTHTISFATNDFFEVKRLFSFVL